MAVKLTKEMKNIREYTPVHMYDEVYPNVTNKNVMQKNNKNLEIATYMCRILKEASKVRRNKYDVGCMIEEDDLSSFFEESVDIENIEVINDRVVCVYRETPISQHYVLKESKILNALQDLLVYVEDATATFEGLCRHLDDKWVADRKDIFYAELCNFLGDIKKNRIDKIEKVLRGEVNCCYDDLMICIVNDYAAGIRLLFHAEYNTRFFKALMNILERDIELKANPLFIFVCSNFASTNETILSCYDDYKGMLKSKCELTAYGKEIEDTVIIVDKEVSKVFKKIDENSIYFKDATTLGLILCLGVLAVGLCITMLGNMDAITSYTKVNSFFKTVNIIAFVSIIGNLMVKLGVELICMKNKVCETNRTREYLYGGIYYFFKKYGINFEFPELRINKRLKEIQNQVNSISFE